jgi:ribonuclease-3
MSTTDNAVAQVTQATATTASNHHQSNNNTTVEPTPFNPRNTLISEEQLAAVIRRHDASTTGAVRDVSLYRKALTHRSYCTRKNENFVQGNAACPAEGCLPLQEESNERLEFLGDAVLNLVVASYLFERYPDENEGFLTRMRTKLVNGNILAELFRKTGLESFTVISKQIEDNDGRYNKKVMEDCFEAFLGALFVDAGFVAAETWLVAFLEHNVDFSGLIAQRTNYKDMLVKYFQHSFNRMPRFVEVTVDGSHPNNRKKQRRPPPPPPTTTTTTNHGTVSIVSQLSQGSHIQSNGVSVRQGDGQNQKREQQEQHEQQEEEDDEYEQLDNDERDMDEDKGDGDGDCDRENKVGRSDCRVCVRNDEGTIVGMGTGATKKAAENDAAYKTLVYYGQIR